MNPKTAKALICLVKSGVWLWFFWITPTEVSAQNTHHLLIQSGGEHIGSRDRGMSPLMYSGYGFFAGLTWQKTSPTQTNEVSLNLSTGMQYSKYGSPIRYHRGSIQVANFYTRKKEEANTVQWGWLMNNVFSHRLNEAYVNFNDHYEYFSNIGPSARYSLPFNLNKRKVFLVGSANVQLLGVMIRPSYTSSFPSGFLNEQSTVAKSLVQSAEVIHPGNSWNFGFRPSFIYPLKSGNRLSLGYNYEFYRLNSTNPVTHSGGLWYISLSSRL